MLQTENALETKRLGRRARASLRHFVEVIQDRCIACGACVGICPFLALELEQEQIVAEHSLCTGCDLCIATCPTDALVIHSSEA